MQNFLITANAMTILTSIVLGFSLLNRHNVRSSYKQAIMGIMFGLGAVLTLLQPITISTGVQVDARNLFIGFAGATAGIIGAGIAFVISGTTRFFIGGVGVWPGIISMFFCAVMGVLWLILEQSSVRLQRLRWVLLGTMISLSIFILLLLPAPKGLDAFKTGGPVLVLIYMMGSLLLGQMIHNENNFDNFRHNIIKDSETDSLTNALNRRGLERRYQRAIKYEESTKISVIIIDIDDFKSVNDTFGHDAGDKALVEVVSRINGLIRSKDIFARLGGDEFVIISFNLDQIKACYMIDRLKLNLKFDVDLPDDKRNLQFSVSASVGGTFSESKDIGLNKLLILADKEMMSVKSNRRVARQTG